MKIAFTCTVSLALLASSPLLAAEKTLPAPIEALQKQGFELKGEFKAPGSLPGYVMQYQGQGTTVFLTPDKQHAIMGNLVDASGKNLSDEQVEKMVYAPMAKEMWQKLEKHHWIAAGKADAPRIVYAFADPYCPYCTQFWQEAQPWLTSGKVQLRVLMVGMLRPDSAEKAAAIMMSDDPSKTLAEYENSQGKMALKKPTAITPQISEALKNNLSLMDELGGNATPSIYYLNNEGRLQQHQGMPDAETLKVIMGDKP